MTYDPTRHSIKKYALTPAEREAYKDTFKEHPPTLKHESEMWGREKEGREERAEKLKAHGYHKAAENMRMAGKGSEDPVYESSKKNK